MSTPPGRLRGLVALSVLFGLFAGCSPADPVGATPASARETRAAPFEPRWTAAVKAVGQPVVAGDVAVVVERVRRLELDIIGLDLDTGDQRWRFPYSPGDLPTDTGILPVVASTQGGSELVVFKSPESEPGSFAPLVAVDPSTGRVLRRGERLRRDLSAGRLTVERASMRPRAASSGDVAPRGTDAGDVWLVATRTGVKAYPDASADPRLW